MMCMAITANRYVVFPRMQRRHCLFGVHNWSIPKLAVSTTGAGAEPRSGHDIQSLVEFTIKKLSLRLLISELAVDGMSIVCVNSLFKESILANVGRYVWLAA